MKAREWREVLERQRTDHGKVLFTVTELVHLARTGRSALNVELSRLRRQGIVTRYAQGLYGLPGAVRAESLLAAIDPHAYFTGIYALHLHGLITQVPAVITCMTDRRSPRAQVRSTPVGRFHFSCVRSEVYDQPAGRPLAGPEQALCDFIYLCRRSGVDPGAQATFRGRERLRLERLLRRAKRYPPRVEEEARRIFGNTTSRESSRR